MKIGEGSFLRRFVPLAVVGVLITLLAACTGRGGGQLPPGAGFTGPASFGFDFSCEDSGGLNPPTGKLRIQLSYADRGTSVSLGAPFSIHGIVDQIDPVLESQICAGQNPPPGGNELIFLGRYYLTSSAPAGFPSTCPTRQTRTSPLCRFEVIVRDNDRNLTPSMGDFFSIKLSSATALDCPLPCSQLPAPAVFYTRAGYLSAGNLTVD
ncbi:MAG TPA: hypothetical protein VFR35_11395 [Actinoplanes sp.]|nr:hypothetical protein [Actinoplanes sp.]